MKRVMVLLAAGLLVISGCSDSDDGGDDADDTVEETETTEAETISLDEWVEEADAICEEYQEELDDMDEPADLEEMQELAVDAEEIFSEQLEALRDLGLPDEDADLVEEALDLLDQQLELIGDLANAEDEDEVLEILEEGEELDEQATEIAQELGLEVCGSDSESDDTDDTTDTTDDDTTDTGSSADGGISELLAAGLGDLGLTPEESSCVSDGMLDEYTVTEMAELDPNDPAVQTVIVEILFNCVTPERIVELNLQ